MVDTVEGGTSANVGENDYHDDEGAIEVVVLGGGDGDTVKASPDDDGGDEGDGDSGGQEAGPEGLEDELREIRKPKLREQMRQLRQRNYEMQHALEAAVRERQQVNPVLAQAQTAIIRAEHRAAQEEVKRLQHHGQWLQEQYQHAAQNGDAKAMGQITESMTEVQSRLGPAAARFGHFNNMMQQHGLGGPQQQRPAQQFQQPQYRPQQAAPPVLDAPAQKWLADHATWHQNDPRRLQAVGQEALKLQRMGYTPDDPEHYSRLNRVLAATFDDFPRRGAETRQRSASGGAVAPVTRGTAGGKTRIEVSAEDMAYLKRNGLDPATNRTGFDTWRRERDNIAKGGHMLNGKIAIESAT